MADGPGVGLVVVSHSRALADAAVALSREMLQGQDVAIEVAAGTDDGGFGTDAAAILEALTAADRGAGVVVLMDLGSAVLSAELALELLDDEARDRVLLCAAPLVEGLVVAAVTAGGGATREQVAAEALAGLAGKQEHLGGPDPSGPATAEQGDDDPGGSDHAGPGAGGSGPGGGRRASFVVDVPHGLHARPAARLVRAAQDQLSSPGDEPPTVLELRNATRGSAWVPATSLSRVATVGAQQGDEVELRAIGPRAAAALDALLALAADGFGEGAGDTGGGAAGAPGASTAAGPGAGGAGAAGGEALAGEAAQPAVGARGPVGASPGVGIGPAYPLEARLPDLPTAPAGDPAQERAALEVARAAVRADLTGAAAGSGLTAEVFGAHLLLLDDPELVDDAVRGTAAGLAAATAWAAAVDRVHATFAALLDPYLRARAADVRAVGDDVLRQLLGVPAPDLAGAEGVLLAVDLTPAQAVALDPTRVVGVVLAQGSPTAHSAILLRARGIPAVVGAGPALLDTPAGAVLALDGGTGEVVVDPDPEVLAGLRARAVAQAAAAERAGRSAATPARTRDGVDVLVGANVGSVEDAAVAAAHGADLAGLVRTEFLFLGRDEAPTVEEQEAVYRAVADALGGRRITLRTLDVGGDKPLPYLPVPPEANPFLGLRGLRLSLAVPGLLADQLLAVVRVAHDTPVSLMFPMVTTVEELLAARAALDEAVRRVGRGRPAGLQVGMMVEVPAAALRTRAFAPHVDFLSIGTNDLTQYALAAERGNPAVSALGDPYDPAVLQLVGAVCAGAGEALVAVCGELASDQGAAALLVGLGVRELSVGPRAVPAVKEAVRALETSSGARLAEQATRATGPEQVRDLVRDSVVRHSV